MEDSATSLAGPKSQKMLRNGLKQLNLGAESMYLHLPDLRDTISYALGPGVTKNDVKLTARSTHIKSQKPNKLMNLVTKWPRTAEFEQ